MKLIVAMVLNKGDFRKIKNIPDEYQYLPNGRVQDEFIPWLLQNVPEFRKITEKEFRSRLRYCTIQLNTKFGKLSNTYLSGPGFEFVWEWDGEILDQT